MINYCVFKIYNCYFFQEPEAPSYNPTKVSAEKKIVRNMPGLSKSKKLAFRQVERKRLANMEREEVSFQQSFATKHEVKYSLNFLNTN